MNIRYHAPAGVQTSRQGRYLSLTTTQGGHILVDPYVLALWEKARHQDLDTLLHTRSAAGHNELELRTALACLSQAGLLERIPPTQAPVTPSAIDGPLISVIIVAYNSQVWLEDCLVSLANQSYSPLEIILVDNHSSDDTLRWLDDHFPETNLVQLSETVSLSEAINTGVEAAQGAYFLLLNPDVRLEPGAVAEMVRRAESAQNCAAVAAKLKLLWAPGFLNGLGNLVGIAGFGSDIGLGHLDLGQFDRLEQLPSACFAAALIPRTAWQQVGPLDTGFPLYYEDVEWCYRARICGYSILAAPGSTVYHAFSSHSANSQHVEISSTKLERVIYGRLRFANKLLAPPYRRRFSLNYFVEDSLRLLFALIRLRGSQVKAIWQGWTQFRRSEHREQARSSVQACRQINDEALFALQKELPAPLIWHGLPLLTWDIIQSVYQPLILSGKTIKLPEFADVDRVSIPQLAGRRKRIRQIIQLEGVPMALYRLYRAIQWRRAQP